MADDTLFLCRTEPPPFRCSSRPGAIFQGPALCFFPPRLYDETGGNGKIALRRPLFTVGSVRDDPFDPASRPGRTPGEMAGLSLLFRASRGLGYRGAYAPPLLRRPMVA